jgi:hypothetical protein
MNNEDFKKIKCEGDGKVVIIKSTDGDIDIEVNGDTDEEMEMIVDVSETKEGDKNIVIKTKVIVCSPDDKDKEKLEKAGINFAPGSEESKLEVNNLNFYPNPNSGKFTLKFNTSQKERTDITIYDINGNEVYSESLLNFSGNYEKEIDISGEQTGTYFLKISQGDKVSIKKIILE